MGPGFVVWLTGLSGAGKSTLARLLAHEMRRHGVNAEVLDGDEMRAHLGQGLGFSREDRDINVRRIGFVAKLLLRSRTSVIVAAISPYREVREEQRAELGRFCEVFCCCSMDVLVKRDTKGLYRRARAGELHQLTGVNDPYEPPLRAEVVVHTDRETEDQSIANIMAKLEEIGYLAPPAGLRRPEIVGPASSTK